ncbi:MAG: glycosyltransferase family 39 protein [bacterium]|nr:glycosyltransferase family 39 protein [bacterium]
MIQKLILKHYFLILFSIFLFGLVLRIYQLGTVPFGFHFDEVANAYGAKFILLNGHDMFGNNFPLLYLDKFGDFPPVLPMYLSGLGAIIFGNTVFGARVFIALVGALAIFPMYGIALRMFKRTETALFTAGMIAVAPWHMSLSRLSAEGIVGLTVYLVGLQILLKSLDEKKYNLLIAATLTLISTFFIYPSFRIIVPLTLLPIFFLQKTWIPISRKNIVFILLPVLAFAITFWISTQPWGTGRFEQTGLVSPMSGIASKLQALIFNEDNITIARIFNNKIIGYSKEFIFQYSRYFSFNYLFGEDGVPKIYLAPYVGLLYTSLLPFILVSVFGYIQRKNAKVNHRFFIFLLYLLIISPIPAALTVLDVPSIQRAILTPALFVLIASYGFNGLLDLKYRKISFVTPLLLIIGVEFIFFTHNYFQHISYYTTHHRNPGNMEITDYIVKHQNEYEEIYVTSQEQWLPVYYLYAEDNYSKSLTGKFKENFRVAQVENVHFPEDNCPAISTIQKSKEAKALTVPRKTLFMHYMGCPLFEIPIAGQMYKSIRTIKRLDETDVFQILEINPDFDESLFIEAI